MQGSRGETNLNAVIVYPHISHNERHPKVSHRGMVLSGERTQNADTGKQTNQPTDLEQRNR